MSNSEKPLEINNNAPNQGAQGIFNAPVHIGPGIQRGLANVKIIVEAYVPPVKQVKIKEFGIFDSVVDRYPGEVSCNIFVEVTEIASNRTVKQKVISCQFYYWRQGHYNNYPHDLYTEYIPRLADLPMIAQEVIKHLSSFDKEGWDVTSISNKVKSLSARDYTLDAVGDDGGNATSTALDVIIRRR